MMRVVALKHYLTDVLAGAAVGLEYRFQDRGVRDVAAGGLADLSLGCDAPAAVLRLRPAGGGRHRVADVQPFDLGHGDEVAGGGRLDGEYRAMTRTPRIRRQVRAVFIGQLLGPERLEAFLEVAFELLIELLGREPEGLLVGAGRGCFL